MNIPIDFDYIFYLNYNDDLRLSNLKTQKQAIDHYINHGRNEKRIYNIKQLMEDTNYVNVFIKKYKFDWNFYLNYNSDIKNVGIITKEGAINHFIKHGLNENRIYFSQQRMSFEINRSVPFFNNFDYIISIGPKCVSCIAIERAGYRDEAYPFDWCYSKNSYNVLNAIKNKLNDYCPLNMIGSTNKYDIDVKMHYKHLNDKDCHDMFKRRSERFFNLLQNSNKNILFVYANEDYINFEHQRDNSDKHYLDVCEINNYLKYTYPNLKFQILCIDSKYRISSGNIINVCIDIPEDLLCNHLDIQNPTIRYYWDLVTNILLDKSINYRKINN